MHFRPLQQVCYLKEQSRASTFVAICTFLCFLEWFNDDLRDFPYIVDDSQPGTPVPTSPTSSHVSMALSTGSGSGNTVPIARTDKHVVLAMSPARPKVSSMQAKLDHTKIEPSLYEQVYTPIIFNVHSGL